VPNQFYPVVTDCAASFQEIFSQLGKYTSSIKDGRTFLFNLMYNLGPIVTSARNMAFVVYYPEYTRIKTWRDLGMEAGQIFYFVFNPVKDEIKTTLSNGGSFPSYQNEHNTIL